MTQRLFLTPEQLEAVRQATEARRCQNAELAAQTARMRATADEARASLERHRRCQPTHADVVRLLRACAVPPRIVAREAFQAPLADDAMPGDCI